MSALACRRFGAPGERPALLAHCYLGHSGGWSPLMGALQTGLDALAIDMPGHGRTPMPAEVGDFQAEVAAAVLPLIASPSLLIGHSFGATVALRLALERPDLVTGLVLIEPVFFAAAAASPEYAPYVETERPLHAAIAAGRFMEAAELFMTGNGDGDRWVMLPDQARAAMAGQMRLVGASIPGVFHDSGRQLAPGRLEGLDLPVLLLAGARSPAMFRAVPSALAARLPRAEVHQVPGAGHMLPITHPAETAALIDAWLARTAA